MLWVLLEVPHRGASNECTQHMFLSRNKKDIGIFRMKKAPYLLLCSNQQDYIKTATDKRGYPHNIFFLFLDENICCGYS